MPAAFIPQFAEGVLADRAKLNKTGSVEVAGEVVEYAYRAGRLSPLEYGDDREAEEMVRCKDVRGVMGPADAPWGAFQFKVLAVGRYADFFMEMDDQEAVMGEAASVIEEAIPFYADLFETFGPMVLFDNVWAHPSAPRAAWKAVAEAVIAKTCPECSLVVLKAFPLGREGEGTGTRRHVALKRHYEGLLGARPLPNTVGEDGWMWLAPPAVEQALAPLLGVRVLTDGNEPG